MELPLEIITIEAVTIVAIVHLKNYWPFAYPVIIILLLPLFFPKITLFRRPRRCQRRPVGRVGGAWPSSIYLIVHSCLPILVLFEKFIQQLIIGKFTMIYLSPVPCQTKIRFVRKNQTVWIANSGNRRKRAVAPPSSVAFGNHLPMIKKQRQFHVTVL